MTESVHVRASYRYASVAARDAAIAAALGVLEAKPLPCAIVLGSTIVVELVTPLFGDADFAVLGVFERGAVESTWAVTAD